jgi:NAD(P)-dependent dehydrogenase (short-subunit alcohol dehydrogenase family)
MLGVRQHVHLGRRVPLRQRQYAGRGNHGVALAVVRSSLWASITHADREQMYHDTAPTPLGRIGEVEDNAQAYLFYLTQPFATGSILTLDGGTVLA